MLRRSTSAPQLQLSLLSATTPPPTAATAMTTARRSFFGNLGKEWRSGSGAAAAGGSDSNTAGSTAGAASNSKSSVSPGMPLGFDLQKLQAMQQLLQSQPKERQEQLLKQAMDMQKMMNKIPGFKKLTQTNTAVMEQLMKMQQQQQSNPGSAGTSASQDGVTAGTSTPGASSSPLPSSPRRDLFSGAVSTKRSGNTGGNTGGGPSLDDLKKVNLGPEIEALFQELRTMRSRKNEYRGKYSTAQAALDTLQREHAELTSREASVRGRLSKAEQEVMLLTSENMELRESSKAVKQLTQANRQLKAEVEQLRAAAQSSAAPGTATYAALQHQLDDRDDSLRSLQRKVERMRRRDPLLQFSLACSNVSRLSTGRRSDDGAGNSGDGSDSTSTTGSGTAASDSSGLSPHGAVSALAAVVAEESQEAADEAFAELQRAYMERQQAAWMSAAHEQGAAARAFVAVVRRYVLTCVPYANYDAIVHFSGDSAALQACAKEVGFQVDFVDGHSGGRAHVTAAPDAAPCTTSPGPFGYALALLLATAGTAAGASTATAGTAAGALKFTITNAQPFVSTALVNNAKRSRVEYETARASGPGGQATNVTETQVYARLSIDGVAAYTAEAQDSRSALNNRDAALEKLQQQRRLKYNDTIARQARAEAVREQLVASLLAQSGFSVEEGVMELVKEAAATKAVTTADAALAVMLQVLGNAAGAA